MENERFQNILKVLLDINDIDVIKYTLESLIEEIQIEIDNNIDINADIYCSTCVNKDKEVNEFENTIKRRD